MKTNRRLLRGLVFFPILICVGSLWGCASWFDSRAAGDYGGFSGPRIKSAFKKQMAHPPQEADDFKPLPEMTSDDFESSGDMYFANGEFYMALVQYEKALGLKSDNTRVTYKKGLLFLFADKYEDAAKEFQAVIEKAPGHASAYEGLGQAQFQMKKHDEAEKSLLKAIENNPKLWKARNFLGNIYDYRKRYDAAQKMYSEAILLNPREISLYNNLGVSLSLAGNYESAIKAFMHALETNGPKEKVYNNLGLVLAKTGQYEAALEAFKKGTDSPRANNNLGCAYMANGEFKEAAQFFRKAIEVSPKFYVKASENLKKVELTDFIN